MNFKIGDTVRVKTLKEFLRERDVVVTRHTADNEVLCYDRDYQFNFLVKMKAYCGKTYRIVEVNKKSDYYRLLEIDNQEDTDNLTICSASVYMCVFQDWMLVPAQETLIIKTDGMRRTSVYQGNKQATVNLWHEDEYDAFVGTVEALAKFYGRKSPFDELKYYKEAYEDVAHVAAQPFEEQPKLEPYILAPDKPKITTKKVRSPQFERGSRFRLSDIILPGSTIQPYNFYFSNTIYEQLKGHIFIVDHVSTSYCSYDGVTLEYQDIYFKIGNALCTYPSFLFTKLIRDVDSDESVRFVTIVNHFNDNKHVRKLYGKWLKVTGVKSDSVIVNGPKNKSYTIPKSSIIEAYAAQEEDYRYSDYKLGDRICLLADSIIARKYSKGTIIGYEDSYRFRIRFDDNFKTKIGEFAARRVETINGKDFRLE